MTTLAIEIGGTKLQVALIEENDFLRKSVSSRIDRTEGAEGIRRCLLKEIATLGPLAADWRVGIGFGGPVNRHNGTVSTSHHVGGWDGFPLASWLSQALDGRSVIVENDANCAAIAEASAGAGRGSKFVLYSNSGSGIGAGFVVDGRLYHGRSGEMELGHLRMFQGDTILEDHASGWSIDRAVVSAIEDQPQGVLAKLADAKMISDATLLTAAIEQDDPVALSILQRAALAYALGISHAVHLLNPDTIVLGGGVSHIGEPWRKAVEMYLETFIMTAFHPLPRVVLAQLGEWVVPIGAARVALQRAIS